MKPPALLMHVLVLVGLTLMSVLASATPPLAAERERVLVHMVRQDCGSCHGLTLAGGLGPALTPAALADKPVEGLVATVMDGRPGTPMPPFRGILSELEAHWIIHQLMHGFPADRGLALQGAER
ncbi:cytochrome C55X NirC [Parazoarcus communis]|uniref:Cytochrome C55X NirC n=1 Tax=Parazoarcus communis TaxID=41977 RepID=A0A2U8HAL2_9RHOO|nr:cytochrome c [Parazoarcus communis]AWI82136.1 cytochrome C55X NirC [Parazoarcus communis]